MKQHAKQIVVWTAFLLFPMFPTSADAQITDYTGTLGNQEFLNFVGVGNSVVSSWTENGSRVYVGPYVGSFGGGGVTSPSFSLICVDFDNFAGSQAVNVTYLGSGENGAGLGATRAGVGEGNFARYQQAAYLASLFDETTTTGAARQTYWSAIHAAIWTVMSGRDIGTSHAATNALRLDLLAGAEEFGSGFSTDGWYLLSAADGYDGQEMLIRGPVSTVPEPSTYLLMATGLLFLVFLRRKRIRDFNEA